MPAAPHRTTSRLLVALVAGLVCALLPAALGIVAPASGGPPRARPRPAADPADAVADVMRHAVTIEGNGVYGAGVLMDPRRGLVVTNLHVVKEMRAPRVSTHDGLSATGAVAAIDRKRDLALLSVPDLASEDDPPRLGAPDQLRPGEDVYAIGTPRKLAFSVSRGIVSAVDRAVEGGRYLQVDMAINDGNSGGPVFNARGEVVGVMSFIMRRSQGLAFATPMDDVVDSFADELGR